MGPLVVALVLAAVIATAVIILRGFDEIAGRGPTQVRDGVAGALKAQSMEGRVPCNECAELILPAAKRCRYCGETRQPEQKYPTSGVVTLGASGQRRTREGSEAARGQR